MEQGVNESTTFASPHGSQAFSEESLSFVFSEPRVSQAIFWWLIKLPEFSDAYGIRTSGALLLYFVRIG